MLSIEWSEQNVAYFQYFTLDFHFFILHKPSAKLCTDCIDFKGRE